ncbi:MAG: glutamine-hydrolyzing carbamoyl-phosphate synthase small subunit [Dehalococcoidales bacterium]|nr:glutamine-hydrolyzing carbamoyl-phosphate synthase small subunit [Dehalococcoidales bacterium]
MQKKANLVLEDGSVHPGYVLGSEKNAVGEVVFCTSMTGYQEMLTDPSYAGQILVPTFPLIGNYGINKQDFESAGIRVSGFVVREECTTPNHYLNQRTVQEYLADSGIPGIQGVDTRAITRRLRSAGVMKGMITSSISPSKALEALHSTPDYGSVDFVKKVSTPELYRWNTEEVTGGYNVVVLDCGLKFNILRLLAQRGCSITVVPCTTSAGDIMALEPDGILLSPGPGDPALLDYVVVTARQLAEKKPVMGICLGSQVIARAFGAKTFKLKFGHRGGNHPVRELADGRIHITAQNHGYAVDPDTVSGGLEITHLNLNDTTVEGIRHRELPVFGIQYHSEASPGPLDNTYLFDRFIELMSKS